MIEAYEPYCLADTRFFEPPESLDDRSSLFDVNARSTPPGWTRSLRQSWVVLRPDAAPMPEQGWKVHASATLDNAERMLAAVWDFCAEHRLPWKFLRSRAALHAANFKYAPRSGSGKLAAIYPADEEQLRLVLHELGTVLSGLRGPYILTDLRWKAGPLFVRYGSFVERYCPGQDGEQVLALRRPDGRLAPDERQPIFHTPDWVDMPVFLATEQARQLAEAQGQSLPYAIESALHFSNAGGVYLAREPGTGEAVVLKEARPDAGLDRNGTDAVARLEQEHRTLQQLAGLAAVPRVHGSFTCWEHSFLAIEYVAGESLHLARARQHPLSYPDLGDAAVSAYTQWALGVLNRVEEALAEVHDRGVAYGDLHPGNIMLCPDGRLVLLDFEQASDLDDPHLPGLGVPGFTSPTASSGWDADRYALGCLRLAMFLPLTGLLQADAGKLPLLLDTVQRRFPVPAGFAAQVRREIEPGLPAAVPRADLWTRPDWDRLRDALVGGIRATATPHRRDRLFPGDPQQFRLGGHTLAYGSAGVVFALAVSGVDDLDEYADWTVTTAEKSSPARPGLFDGLCGVAYVLDRLGRRDQAMALLDRAPTAEGPALFSGLAGIGLAQLHFGLSTLAADSAAQIIRMLDEEHPLPGGLLRGWSGAALFLTRMFEHNGDPALLDAAVTALDRDLARCQDRPGGSIHLSDGIRVQPFLADGSVGVGLALAAIRAHRDNERYAALAAGISAACHAEFVYEPGLFHGRAGMIAGDVLVNGVSPVIHQLVRRLAWQAMPWQDHILFPGRMLLRLSADLATGSGGVLLALHGVLSGDGPQLPIPLLRPAYATATAERR